MVEFAAALAVTLAAVPLARGVLLRARVVDVPNVRSSHLAAVARGGGIGCGVGVLVGAMVSARVSGGVPWVLLVVVMALALLGLSDDVWSVGPAPRLVAQVAAGAAAGGLVGENAMVAVAGVLVLTFTVNTVNFMDGINGITGLTMALWGLVAQWAGEQSGSHDLILIGAVTAASALGFLPYNFPRARVFLGDSGSYLFGALVGIGLLVAWRDGASLGLVGAPLVIYFADVLSTLVIRGTRGQSLTQAHRDHVYQLLVSRAAWSHTRTAFTVAGLAAIATLSWAGPQPLAVVVTLLLAVGYLLLRPWVLAAFPNGEPARRGL